MASLFISYCSEDRKFIRKLSNHLRQLGHQVWLDEWKTLVGQCLVSEIQKGIEDTDFVAVALSKKSVKSGWVEREWQAKYWEDIEQRRIRVLPLLIEDCDIPTLLKPKKYADFRRIYIKGLVDLSLSLNFTYPQSGITEFHTDIVDFHTWGKLLEKTTKLDLVLMYGDSWRNTYLKYIIKMLEDKGRLRVVLPEVTHLPLCRLYSERLGCSEKEFKSRIARASLDFQNLAKYGQVEIYTCPTYFHHAIYLFDNQCVLSLYSYRGRVETPFLILEDGLLMQFIREDFDWLISPSNPMRIQSWPRIKRTKPICKSVSKNRALSQG